MARLQGDLRLPVQRLVWTQEKLASEYVLLPPFITNPRKFHLTIYLVYTYDPTQGLTAAQKKLVLGGEVHVWSEQIDEHSIDASLWPRAGAAAEVLWSGRQDAGGKNRTFMDASPRLAEIRERMVNWGINAAPLMQLW